MTKMLGGEVVAAMLAAEGVDTVFGIVDGTYMGLYASFEKHGIRLISPRHETSAAHMAGAYARLTGKLGVCMASNGPGVANVLPGVAVENGEGNRVLLLTSSRRQGVAYPDRCGTFQCFDQVGVTAPMTKHSEAVMDAARLPEAMRRVLRAGWQGRPGVVHLDVPENVYNGPVDVADGFRWEPSRYRRTEPMPPTADGLARSLELLRQAERPLIQAGSGVIHAGAEAALARLAESLEAPVTTSWGARAALADASPYALPTWAMEVMDQARRDADVVLVLGSRLGETDWWGKAPHWGRPDAQRIIQVDVDESVIGANRPADVALVADIGAYLEHAERELGKAPVATARLDARRRWVAGLREARQVTRGELDEALTNDGVPMHTSHVPAVCRKVFGDDAVLVVDGGNTAVWCSFFHEIRATNTLLSTFKFGMLGAGVAQALGAKAARPEAPVYCILGDGAMGFHLQEIETAVRHGLAVTYLVICDRQWGMVKLTQHMGLDGMRAALGVSGDGTINADLAEIAFDRVAEAMGAHGERVSAPADLEPALRRCLESGKASVIHVDVDAGMHLFAPGLQEFKLMHQEPAG